MLFLPSMVRDSTKLALGLTIAVVFAIGGAGVVLAAQSHPSKGPIPPNAFKPGGAIDAAAVPDFVSVTGPDGTIVGYVTKQVAIDPPLVVDRKGRPEAATVPVYGSDLTTVVGELVPDKGFVPADVDPASVPSRPVEVAPAP